MNTASACLICKEPGHKSSECKHLHDALKEGFFSGGGSGGSHNHDEEDESLSKKLYTFSFSSPTFQAVNTD